MEGAKVGREKRASRRADLHEEETQLRELELGSPVCDHRREQAAVLVWRPAVILALERVSAVAKH